MTSKISLKVLYPSLEGLFRFHLNLPIAGMDTLAIELQELSVRWQGQVIPDSVKDQISHILADFADFLSKKTAKFSEPWLRKLAQQAVFPVEVPLQGSRLRAPGDFYIPDKSGDLLEMFTRDVPFLSLSEKIGIQRIQPLFESVFLKSRFKFLEKLVKHFPIPHGQRQPDEATRNMFAMASSYIKR